MDPQVIAAVVAGALTVIGTLAAQFFGRRGTSKDAEKALVEQREQLSRTFAEQREQLNETLKAQSDQLDKTLVEQRTRTLNERFATAAEQLGSDRPAVRLAGVYAMAGLADDWKENRQTCVDVLCAYLRMPYEPDPGQDAPEQRRLVFQAIREVRHTVIRVITAHLKKDAEVSWQGLNFDFTGVVFDGGDFTHARFSGGRIDFGLARFSDGMVSFAETEFADGEVSFAEAEFSGGVVTFARAKFSGGYVFFHVTEFSGSTVAFYGAEFSGSVVDFTAAKFYGGEVKFDDAKFYGGNLDFFAAEFSHSKVSFTEADFSGSEVNFRPPGDWSTPPTFPWTGPPLPGVTLPQKSPGVKLPRKEDQSQA